MKRKLLELENLADRNTWLPLWLFNLYRLVVASLFLTLYELGPYPSILGQHQPTLFEYTSIFYFAFTLLSSITIRRRRPDFEIQANLQVFTDIIVLTLLMHASGGITSGLGLLLVAVVAGASIVLSGRLAFLHAAFASLAVLTEQIYAHIQGSFDTTAYTQAGMLGTVFFASALFSHIMARRARESEALARQRSVDVANLEQLNDFIVRNTGSGIIVVDQENRIRLMNPAAWKLLCMPGMQPRQPLASIAPELARCLQQWKSGTLSTEACKIPNAQNDNLRLRFQHIGEGAHGGTLIHLESTREIAQRAQQMKLASMGRVTAGIAHEIRNPLGAISHAAQLLDEATLPAEDARLIEIIRSNTQRMNSVIESILQLSRREPPNPRAIPLAQWLTEFFAEFCPVEKLEAGQVQIRLSPADLAIEFDRDHLHQLMWNLCRNAVVHSGLAPEAVRIELQGALSEDERSVRLDIMDNGPGIPPERVEEIFEPFVTSHSAGTGLGLHICRELCEINQAHIQYLALPSGGGCFRIFFNRPLE